MLNGASLVDGPKALEFNIAGNANADDCLRKVEQRVATLVARQLSVRSDQGSVHSGEDVVLTVTVPKGIKGAPLKRKLTNGLKEKKLTVAEDKNNARVISVVIPQKSVG
ncbi:hypothetical protein K523DRAFT_237689 [Schizophyllum commune Tattone D]|nr:hypothetical protein K523DRAFT_237689 [Schizophyllum commune Tattone D]